MSVKVNGFHASVNSFADGIGDFLRDIDRAGLSCCTKSADGTTGLVDLQNIMRTSDVRHYPIFRRTSFPFNQGGSDIPDPHYQIDPIGAARRQWEYFVEKFPADLDKSLIWNEIINEPSKEIEHASWIARFMIEASRLALRDGYKLIGPGWATGNPDLEVWENFDVLDYLALCADHKHDLGVALHEYSLDKNDIWNQNGFLIGRFVHMFKACDQHGLAHPNVFFTEWGWEERTVPHVDQAMRDIEEVAELYAQYPAIKGANIWALDKGWDDLHKETHALMAPLKDFIIATGDPDPPDPPDDDNLLRNGGFELGWEDRPSFDGNTKNHIPDLWDATFAPKGVYFRGFEMSAQSENRVLHESDLPENERPGQPDSLFRDGVQTYKVFAAWATWVTKLSTVVVGLDPNQRVKITVPFNCHFMDERPSDFDPRDILLEAWTNHQGDLQEVWIGDMTDRQWDEIVFETSAYDTGLITLYIRPSVIFPHPTAFFFDGIRVEKIDGDIDPPEKITRVFVKLPQEMTSAEFEALAPNYFNDKRTFGFSHDDALDIAGHPNSNERSFIEVVDPHHPSQQEIIRLAQEQGIAVVRTYTNDDIFANLQLGYLFEKPYTWTSEFNAERNYGNGLHEGSDYDVLEMAIDSKEPVLCTYPGVVSRAVLSSGAYGKFIVVAHSYNGQLFYTWYCHLDDIYVRVGDQIDMGDQLGEIGATGGPWGEHVHFNLQITGRGLSGYVVPDVVDPEPFFAEHPHKKWVKITPPYQAPLFNLLHYMRGDGRSYDVKHISGAMETFQTQIDEGDDRIFYQVKNQQWERLYVVGATHIGRGTDISPGPMPDNAQPPERPGAYRWYRQFESGLPYAKWVKIFMHEGETFTGPGHYVEFAYKSDCAPSALNSGPATNVVKFVKHHVYKVFNNFEVRDVIELRTSTTGETMFYARGYGLVGWRNSDGKESGIIFEHAQPVNLQREKGCFD